MDELLSGGEGQGIFTADDIQAEKQTYFERLADQEMQPSGTATGDNDLEDAPVVGGSMIVEASTSAVNEPSALSDPQTTTVQKSRFSGAPKGKGKLK